MATTTTKKRTSRRLATTWASDLKAQWKENTMVNSQKPAVSRTMQFARENKGAVVVKDPTFLLF